MQPKNNFIFWQWVKIWNRRERVRMYNAEAEMMYSDRNPE